MQPQEPSEWWDLKLTDAQRAELDERLARSDLRRAMAETITARDRAAERHRYWHDRYDELAGPIATALANRERADLVVEVSDPTAPEGRRPGGLKGQIHFDDKPLAP